MSVEKTRTRQKACDACANSKQRCIRQAGAGTCVRCARQGQHCIFPTTRPGVTAQHAGLSSVSPQNVYSLPSPASIEPATDRSGLLSPEGPRFLAPTTDPVPNNGPSTAREDNINFSNLDMVCPIDASDISNRWLKAYIPDPANKAKQYSGPTVAFIYRLLKSFASAVVRGEGIPSFVHHLQTSCGPSNDPLSTCVNLVRVLNGPRQNVGALSKILLREMEQVYAEHEAFDAYTTVAAFQAYAVYTLVLFFFVSDTHGSLYQAMMNLQILASTSARVGCMCRAEQDRTRPQWEEWITAEAQRRTLYAMYMFDSILSSRDGLPTFLGTELKGLPAPGSGTLWRAASRSAFENEYDRFIASWPDGMLGLHELWPMPIDFGDTDINLRRARVDRWLINLDEYGTMLYTVTSSTHGS